MRFPNCKEPELSHSRSVLGKHISNSIKEELDSVSVVAKFATTASGASLKDLGKKWFAFSKIELDSKELLRKLTT